MSKREDYDLILLDLKSSQDEEGVIENITKIIKGFSSDFYKNDLYENPYFKSFVSEIKEKVVIELNDIRLSLKDEIITIDNELLVLNSKGITSVKDPDISKLRNLKKECILLIKELENRLEELYFL